MPSNFQRRRILTGGTPTLNAEVLVYAGNMAAAGATVTTEALVALNTLVTRGKANNWFNKLIEVYPVLGSTLSGAAVKLKWGVGSPSSLDVSRLAAGDYSQAGGLGPTAFNGTKWAMTGWTPANDGVTQTNMSIVVARADGTRTAQAVGEWLGDTPASGEVLFAAVASTNNNNGTSPRSDIGPATIPFYMGAAFPRVDVVSYAVNSQKAWNNSHVGYISTTVLSSALTTEIALGRIRRGGAFRVEPFKMVSTAFGTALTDAEAADVGMAFYEFEMAVGRTIFTGTPMYFIGDSNGAGQGAQLYANTWATQVAVAKGRRPMNFSVPGSGLSLASATRVNAYTNRAELLKYPPGVVIMCHGTNDGQYDGVLNGNPVTIADFKAKMIEMVNLWQAYGHTVVLCSLPYSTNANLNDTKRAAYATATSEAATSTGAVLVDLNSLMSNSTAPLPGAMLADNIHLNPTGHSFVANAIISVCP